MFSARRWNWFIIASLLSASVGCAHHSCTSCHPTSASPTIAGYSSGGSITSMKVVADPAGGPGSYLIISSSNLPPFSNNLVKGTPSTLPPVLVPPKETPVTLPTTKLFAQQFNEPSLDTVRPQTTPSSVTLKTAEPETSTSARYDHSTDYRWVMGKLEYLYSKKVWRVRYAPAEVEDDLGGCVTLIGVDYLAENLKDGQMVRVDGVLVDPESKQISPQYQVYTIKPVD